MPGCCHASLLVVTPGATLVTLSRERGGWELPRLTPVPTLTAGRGTRGCLGLGARPEAGGATAALEGAVLRITLLRGLLPAGVKVSSERSQRAQHMALVWCGAPSCHLPPPQPGLHLI